MSKTSYSEESVRLSKAVDIAIEAIQKFPPKGFAPEHVKHFVNSYSDFKNQIENPEPGFDNTKSLKYLQNDVFTFFQEGSGDAVNHFWEQISDHELGYKRQNKLTKILKRQKIKSKQEYDFVTDVLVPYQKEGLIAENEAKALNSMMADFTIMM